MAEAFYVMFQVNYGDGEIQGAIREGTIAYDNRSGYRRQLTNVGLTAEKRWRRATLTSVTGFQHLHDRMDLDQDFTSTNLYTLMQRQNINTLSEELILKSADNQSLNSKSFNRKYAWLFGLSMLQQWTKTDGPVTFREDGISWLNSLINRQGNAHLPTITSRDAMGNPQYTMNFVFSDEILGSEFAFPGTYKTPSTNAAVFHQSTLNRLFGISGLTLTAGLRLDYEHHHLDYDPHYTFTHRYGLGGRLTYPSGAVNSGMTLVPARNYNVTDGLEGSLSKSYLQLLPRLTLQYAFRSSKNAQLSILNSQLSTIYASVSRGYRSGGYNLQMFSDLLQSRMQTAIMKDVANATVPVVDAVNMIPSDVKLKVRNMLIEMGTPKPIDVEAATWYEPETSWNYEAGAHLNLFGGRLTADVAAFWMETRNQQVSKMTEGGLGRVTVNSGKSRSVGAEASFNAHLTDRLSLQAAYGFTDARFRGDRDGYVPFIPRHTFSVGATQEIPLDAEGDVISLHADYRAAGRIYWTEAGDAWQNFAGTLHARVAYRHPGALNTELAFYADNLLGTRFQTFYFETMQRGFAQYARPAELGLQLRFRF